MAQPKAPRTKAHAVKFTDEDWERVKKTAEIYNMTPAAYVNWAVGKQLKNIALAWDGLQAHGWPKGKKRKPTPTS